MYKTRQSRSTFGSCDVKKCAPVWREAHSKSKCTKHTKAGPLLEVVTLKKCTLLLCEAHSKCAKHAKTGARLEAVMSRRWMPLRREARVKVKARKANSFGPLLNIQMSFCMAGVRETTTTTTLHYRHCTAATATAPLRYITLH